MSSPLTPETLVFDLVTPAEPRVSPDGTRIVYGLATTDRESRRSSSQIWLRDIDGGNPRRLTASGERNRGACWSPDGRSIAFISDRVKRSGIYILPVAEPGEAREVIRDAREIADLAWSPDGGQIAYVVAVDPENPDESEPRPDAAPRVRVTRRLDYKADGSGYLGDRRRQIFVATVDGGERRQLTSTAVDHGLPQWSPDGRRLAVQVTSLGGQFTRLGLIDAATGEMHLVGSEQGVVGSWAWSPAGDRILFAGDITPTGQLDFFVHTRATGEVRRLTDDLECLPDAGRLGQAPPASPVWLDERRVLFHAFRAGASALYTLDTETGSVEPVHAWQALHAGLSVDAAQRSIVQARTSLESPGELGVFDRASGQDRRITAYNAALLRERPTALWERFEVERDGLTIEAWLLKPPDFDPARRYPVILDVHGGPQAFYGYSFDPVQQLLATHGFLVVFCNPRGSTSYGRDFTLRVRRDWGGEDYHDLMAVLDTVLARPEADADRVGIYGSSYGGYMTAWAITQTDRFKAAVSRAPVFDLESFHGTSDIGHAWGEMQFGGPPHERREWYAAHSPSTFAHQARTPTLIIHGETDERCPIGQGEQMFVALSKTGYETEFARYPGGSHLFFRPSGLPEHRLDFLGRVLGWFTRLLGGPAGDERVGGRVGGEEERREMKITAVKAFVVDELGNNRVFAKVYTDEGLVGMGEGTLGSRCLSIAAAITENERYLIGQDPRDIEGLWQAMYRAPRWRGGPILNSAISALDTALWDILGQSLGVPIYRLLGGACRDRVRICAQIGADAPEAVAEQALAAVAEGYTAVKTSPYPLKDGRVESRALIRTSVAKVAAIRAAVGEDVEIVFDCHGVFTPVMSVDFARRVEEYHPLFLEEPTQAEDLDILAWVGQRTAAPLATGERLFTKWGFADLVARHLVSYVQPDVAHCGGISELKKIASLAEAHFIDVAPHHGNSEVTTLASLHVDVSAPNCVIQERPLPTPLAAELFGGVVEVVDGYAALPTRPGLGFDLNEAVAAKHPYVAEYERTGRARLSWADGSIADP